MDQSQVYIMEMVGDYYRGIVAQNESEAREIAISRGHSIKSIVRVEKLIEPKGETE